MSVSCTGKANITHQANNRLLPTTRFYISDPHIIGLQILLPIPVNTRRESGSLE